MCAHSLPEARRRRQPIHWNGRELAEAVQGGSDSRATVLYIHCPRTRGRPRWGKAVGAAREAGQRSHRAAGQEVVPGVARRQRT
eukprot:13574056-Alexandrium_andersonii.AAC.1